MRLVRIALALRWLLLASVVFCGAMTACAEQDIALTDSAGHRIGTVPVMLRGEEKMIPIRTLSFIAGWTSDETDSGCVVSYDHTTVTLRASIPFALAGEKFVQLRVPPELWDGSFWVPLSSVEKLFGGSVLVAARDNAIAILHPPATPDAGGQRARVPIASTWALKTIIVDPGHGGKDPGAPGPSGWKEKAVTLDIARRLESLITKRGLTVKLTRDGDKFVSLQQRTHFANISHGDLFLSIHCNSNRDPSIHGVEAYFLKPARTESAVEVALRENSVVKLEGSGADYRDLTQENYILLSMAASRNLKDSESWAARVSRQAAAKSKLASRGVDQAGFYVLMGTMMPAVLVECGYLSNAADAKVLASEQGRQAIAEALLNSILDMKTNLETPASP